MDINNIKYKKTTVPNGSQIEYAYLNATENKRPIVFLYGLVCNNRHFEPQISHFSRKGHPILIQNYRHHFGSTSAEPLDLCNFEKIAEDCHLLMEKLGIKNPMVIGHSMGVNVAIELSLRKNTDIHGLVLISGSPHRPQDFMFNTNLSDVIIPLAKKIFGSNQRILNRVWKNSYKSRLLRLMVLRGGFNPSFVEDEFVKYYVKKIGELGSDVFFKLIEEMKNHNLTTKLHLVNCPTLVMGGDLDKIAPIEGQIVFNTYIKDSSFYLIKDGSHVPQIDFPKTVNEQIENFI